MNHTIISKKLNFISLHAENFFDKVHQLNDIG